MSLTISCNFNGPELDPRYWKPKNNKNLILSEFHLQCSASYVVNNKMGMYLPNVVLSSEIPFEESILKG